MSKLAYTRPVCSMQFTSCYGNSREVSGDSRSCGLGSLRHMLGRGPSYGRGKPTHHQRYE